MSTTYKGIDVSKWQGVIDWEKAKADGVEFAMIRAGYGQNNIDEYFKRNADECTRLGIPFGVYWFSYAYNVEMAKKEAQYCINAIKPYNLDYPVAFDFEYDSVDFAEDKGVNITKTLATDMTVAFCDVIKNAGYTACVYANPNYLAQYFDSRVYNYDIWLAKWPKNPNLNNPPENADIWQYTSSGAVNGIYGRVDMNVSYKDYKINDTEGNTMDYETEKKLATEWVKNNGISDGERPNDPIKRVEMWVMLKRIWDKVKDVFE